MKICPKCNSLRVQTIEKVIWAYRCRDCGWIEISQINPGFLQSFPSRQYLCLLHRSSWVYTIFFLVFLGGGYLISDMVITPAQYFALGYKLPLFSEKSRIAGEIKSKSVTAEAPVILAPSSKDVPGLPVVSPSDTESVSLQQSYIFHVVANSDSKHYHLPGMTWYNNISSHHRVIFPSEEAAQQAGYHKAPR